VTREEGMFFSRRYIITLRGKGIQGYA
jgi:hypothetical protein